MAYLSKAEFVAQLAELLKNAGMGITGLELSEDSEKVMIHYEKGKKLAPIEMDSHGTIVYDVIRTALFK
jgi:hypothetical protein